MRSSIFDLDGTLARDPQVIRFLEKGLSLGVFSGHVFNDLDNLKQAWEKRNQNFDTYIEMAVEVMFKQLTGKKVGIIKAVASATVAEQFERLYTYTRHRLQKSLTNEDEFTAVVSHSPEFLVGAFCSKLGVKNFTGTKYEVKDGRFTGVCLDPISGYNKWQIYLKLLQSKNYRLESIKYITAYDDTLGGISLFKKADRPVCFNPCRLLFLEAQRRGWEVVIERKDLRIVLKPEDVLKRVKVVDLDL